MRPRAAIAARGPETGHDPPDYCAEAAAASVANIAAPKTNHNTMAITIQISDAFAQLALLTGVLPLKAQTNSMMRLTSGMHISRIGQHPVADGHGLVGLVFHGVLLGLRSIGMTGMPGLH